MNKQFRIAQKTGLMFRDDEILPEDMNAWIQSQLQAASPALGLASSYADVAPWPDGLQPDLSRRAAMWRRYRDLEKQAREEKNGQETQAARQANRHENLTAKLDEHKFVQRNVYGADQVKLRFTAFWANHFTIGNTFDTGQMIYFMGLPPTQACSLIWIMCGVLGSVQNKLKVAPVNLIAKQV